MIPWPSLRTEQVSCLKAAPDTAAREYTTTFSSPLLTQPRGGSMQRAPAMQHWIGHVIMECERECL